MGRVIIKWTSNWADEMDVEGFVFAEKNDAEEWLQKMSEIKSSFNICVGTNEEIDYENGEEFSKEIKIIDITDEEEKTIIKFLGRNYGQTSFYQKFYNYR